MTLSALIKRNTKMFFKDKGLFFTSLITPLILLVLYVTFLGNVYKDSFSAGLAGIAIDDGVLNSVVASQLVSSLLAVCCVTVSFCSNMLMVQDKVSGARNDMTIAPVRPSTLALGYYISTLISTLIISFIAAGAGFAYIALEGWYLTVTDLLLVILDIVLLVLFGTALSSTINFFLSSQGQISAVGSIVSSVYGFICGAYMPISQFGDGLQKVLMFLPGTHATSLLRTHLMRGSLAEVEKLGVPEPLVEVLKDTVDCNIYLFGDKIADWTKLAVLCGSVVVFIAIYVALNMTARKRRK
jgi:multidrug/hemolysin transport system permease protein